MFRRLRLALVVLLAGLVAACASTPPAPVHDRSIGAPRKPAPSRVVKPAAGGEHVVVRGDTLYSIAFRNGLDYRDLARINGIAPPYTIHVGQRIRLTGAASPRVAAAPAPRQPPRAPPPRAEQPRPAPATPKAPMFEDVPPAAPPRVASTPPATTLAPAPPPPAATPPKPAPPATGKPPVAATSNSGIAWRWPAEGPRLNGFVAGDPTRQGIDIGGRAGDAVRAAADGEVVYSGNGLIGYGELVIIKHSPALLSAYGHNRRRLVQEGDKVKAGQQIAEMGSSSASREMLHFEIRRNGKPVDPAAFLPAR